MTDWQAELEADAEALEGAIRREARRMRLFKALEVVEVQKVLDQHSMAFARVIRARKKLLELIDRRGREGSGGGGSGGGGGNYVVRHRQEGHVDEKLVTAYEALWIKTYGSGAGYIGDPNALVPTGAGGNQSKMSGSGERVYRGVAKSKGGGLGASRRSIIKDERAFDFKRKMDKRMRRMASEIDEWLRSTNVSGVDIKTGGRGRGGEREGSVRCGDCQCFVERDWRFCARCGAPRAIASRRDDVRGA